MYFIYLSERFANARDNAAEAPQKKDVRVPHAG
jgi:hypothetical protein